MSSAGGDGSSLFCRLELREVGDDGWTDAERAVLALAAGFRARAWCGFCEKRGVLQPHSTGCKMLAAVMVAQELEKARKAG